APHVGFDEGHIRRTGFVGAPARHRERIARLIDTYHCTLRTDEFAGQSRHVAQPGAEVEDAKAASDSGGLQHNSSRLLNRCRLAINSRKLRRFVTEHVSSATLYAHALPPFPLAVVVCRDRQDTATFLEVLPRRRI